VYKLLLKPLLFSVQAEKAHHLTFKLSKLFFKIPGFRAVFKRMNTYRNASLERTVFGLKFPNPVGLAAGFDKDAKMLDVFSAMGFGFIEIGTLTPKPQAGNPLPRLFRLPQDQSLINRMGFNNEGVDAAVERLRNKPAGLIVGGNIGKNKDTPNDKAANDYHYSFEKLFPVVDYFVVNVSSPNTPGLRELQEKEPLTALLMSLQELNFSKANPKPILLKIAPDLSNSQLDDIIEIVTASKLAGIIATNTTISRENLITSKSEVDGIGAGGLSGKVLANRSTEVIRYLHQKSAGKIPIIGVGGIFSANDALEKLRAGASLVQVYSGLVYEGPSLPGKICRGLAKADL
jgi:dihydroorotate dehydrogenase